MYDIDKIKAQWARQRPDLDTEPMALIGRITRLSAHLSEEMGKTFARHGLNGPSFDMLATLLRSGPPHALSPNQLLETMMVTSGTMTNRIDQLEKDDLVTRVRNPDDKRSVLVQLTGKGQKIIDAAVTDHVETQKKLVAGLSGEERGNLNALLRTYLATFEAD
ncbi:MarR family transcriptional regulator [Sulfitobacter sp. G21635-S1]|jgi:DNA-binding MarR family transcriptional regulator|uniref:MarR family winged helix-turn-helix transcriptional regulator n=1 Tax=Sulfitobacter sp. G21635-S1 TaxID=3014043 RepID=UPI0022B01058|nr:MarR family transcriptional regulator [Sulfitobacter sp. G21635-S1]MCZ4256378.1 MarR family transcriptional regulator [Sulfitobacter sp. G21635-S1]